MIARYSHPEMARIWTQESKYEAWLKVELAVCEVYAKRGIIPTDALGGSRRAPRSTPRASTRSRRARATT